MKRITHFYTVEMDSEAVLFDVVDLKVDLEFFGQEFDEQEFDEHAPAHLE